MLVPYGYYNGDISNFVLYSMNYPILSIVFDDYPICDGNYPI